MLPWGVEVFWNPLLSFLQKSCGFIFHSVSSGYFGLFCLSSLTFYLVHFLLANLVRISGLTFKKKAGQFLVVLFDWSCERIINWQKKKERDYIPSPTLCKKTVLGVVGPSSCHMALWSIQVRIIQITILEGSTNNLKARVTSTNLLIRCWQFKIKHLNQPPKKSIL